MTTAAPIVVVVATRNRAALLRARCLPSIRAQRRRPDAILVIDDSDPPCADDNARAVAAARAAGLPVLYERAARRLGAAAAWNRSLRMAARLADDPWIAIHDDDDSWTVDHLRVCEDAASPAGANVVISGIRVVVDGRETPQPLLSTLAVTDFLRGNPGWQGSNTFVRLALLREVDGFDEQLPACLDRDLAIRILDCGSARVAFTRTHSVRYFIDSNREALSRRGSPIKRDALERFYRKHACRMTADDRSAFADRASRLFGVSADVFREPS